MHRVFFSNKAFLVNPRGLLLLMKNPEGNPEPWDLPGGRMEAGEKPTEALAREVLEETGIVTGPSKAWPFFTESYHLKNDPASELVPTVFYIVPCGEADVIVSPEHVGFRWIDPRQPLADDITGTVVSLIERYRQTEGIVTAQSEIKGRQGFGFIQLFTGNGKGKTTAAIGEAVRAVGAGKRVGIVFFDKGGTHYAERAILDRLGIAWIATGRDRIDPVSGRFDFSIQDVDKAEAARGLVEARKMFEAAYDLVILDEINSTTDLGMIAVQDVLTLLEAKPERTELILTGRNAPEAFLDRAHLVTEMKLRKHYFYSGVKAREGLDF